MSRALPQPIADSLAVLRRALVRWLLTAGLARICAVAALLSFLSLAADWYFRMDKPQRGLSLLIGLGIVGYVAWRYVIRPVRRRWSDDELSWDVELRHPELGQSLISAVQFSAGTPAGTSAALTEAAISAGARRIQSLDVRDVLDATGRGRNLLIGVVALAALLGAAMAFPRTMSLWLRRNLLLSEETWPQRTYLSIAGIHNGELRIPRGDDLEIWVNADGVVPGVVTVEYSAKSAGRGSEQLVRVGDRGFRWNYRNVLEPMRLRVYGGDAVSGWVPLRLAERPIAQKLKFSVQPPAYTKLGRTELPLGEGSYQILRGSVLYVSGVSNKALARAEMSRGKDALTPVAAIREHEFMLELPAEQVQSGAYQMQLHDIEGLWSKPPLRFNVRVVDDAKPLVRAKLEGIGELISVRATIPLSFKAVDDYGLTDISLAYHDPAAAPAENEPPALKRIDFPELKKLLGSKEIPHSYRLEAEPLRLAIDSHLSFFVEAKDNDVLSGPKAGQSTTFSLKVVTDEVLRNELLRREQEQRQEFERVLDQQKGLLADTKTALAVATTQPVWPEPEHRRLKDAEKRQRLLGQRCDAIAAQFAQILAEVENNKLEETGGPVRKRLNDGIISPLRSLASTLVPRAADQLDQAATASLAKAPRLDAAAKAVAAQEQIVAKMRDILRSMVKWEGYQEAVLLLREVLKDQQGVNEATIKQQQALIRRIFGDEPKEPKK